MTETCRATRLAAVLDVIDGSKVAADAWDCPDPAAHVVTVDRPGVYLAFEVCDAHELLIAAEAAGYGRSIRKRIPTT